MTHQHNSVTDSTKGISPAWSWVSDHYIAESHPDVEDFLGRTEEIGRLEALLDTEHALLISGLPGVGKSKLGAKLASRHKEGQIFWYTFWTGINDSVASVLWQIGLFLTHRDRAEIALTLVNEGIALDEKIELLVQSLARENYVFCFDRLEVVDAQPEVQMLLCGLCAGLRCQPGAARILMMSRSIPAFLAPEDWESLNGFNFQDAFTFLSRHSVDLSTEFFHELYLHTAGNPRLLEMFATWFHQIDRNQHEIAKFVNMPFVYRGIKNYLLESVDCAIGEDERNLLQLLSASQGTISYISLRHASDQLGIANFDSTVVNLCRKHTITMAQDAIHISSLIANFYRLWLIRDMGLRTRLKQICQ